MMNFVRENTQDGVSIPHCALELSGLHEEQFLRLITQKGVSLIMHSEMTAEDVAHTLYGLVSVVDELLEVLQNLCDPCDNCGQCRNLLNTRYHLPSKLLEEAGLTTDSKLYVAVEDGAIIFREQEEDSHLSDLPQDLLMFMKDYGMCLQSMEYLMEEGDVIYGRE